MRSILFVAAAGALLCSPAIAGDKPAADVDKERLICKAVDVSATRIARKKACMTRAQWKQLAEDQSNEIRKQGTRTSVGDGGNTPGRGF